jgi:hypothetical protein
VLWHDNTPAPLCKLQNGQLLNRLRFLQDERSYVLVWMLPGQDITCSRAAGTLDMCECWFLCGVLRWCLAARWHTENFAESYAGSTGGHLQLHRRSCREQSAQLAGGLLAEASAGWRRVQILSFCLRVIRQTTGTWLQRLTSRSRHVLHSVKQVVIMQHCQPRRRQKVFHVMKTT